MFSSYNISLNLQFEIKRAKIQNIYHTWTAQNIFFEIKFREPLTNGFHAFKTLIIGNQINENQLITTLEIKSDGEGEHPFFIGYSEILNTPRVIQTQKIAE